MVENNVHKLPGQVLSNRAIGIVGGVGPYAGLDLNRKIYEQCQAGGDQGHLTVYLISAGCHIPDRTEFLLGRGRANPARGINEVLRQLDDLGVPVAGIPCNTSHAEPIFGQVRQQLRAEERQIRLLHMIEELGDFLMANLPAVRRVGVLATDGTVSADVYGLCLQRWGITVLYPSEHHQRRVHEAIYDPGYGLKATGQPVSLRARTQVMDALRELVERDVEAVVLGCTELPLAVRPGLLWDRPVIDATAVLARALIREVAPGKLRALAWERPQRQQATR